MLRTLIVAALLGLAAAPAGAASPKGYAVAEIKVTDPEAYKAYVAAVTPLVAQFGGVYIIRGGEADEKEGAALAGRFVVIEFASYVAARAFYNSPEYQKILPLRLKSASSRIFIVEGYTDFR